MTAAANSAVRLWGQGKIRTKKIGTIILNGAVKSGENEWKGSLLNTDDGKTYAGVVTMEGADEINLKGCAFGIICQGETWRRAN